MHAGHWYPDSTESVEARAQNTESYPLTLSVIPQGKRWFDSTLSLSMRGHQVGGLAISLLAALDGQQGRPTVREVIQALYEDYPDAYRLVRAAVGDVEQDQLDERVEVDLDDASQVIGAVERGMTAAYEQDNRDAESYSTHKRAR